MKIALAQLNYTIGDIAGNTAKIIIAVERAKEAGADVVIFAEQALCGTPAFDLLRKTTFLELCDEALDEIASYCNDITAVVGSPILMQNGTQSAAVVIENGKIKRYIAKANITARREMGFLNSGEGAKVVRIAGEKVAIVVGDDFSLLKDVDRDVDIIFSINARRYGKGLMSYRYETMHNLAFVESKTIALINHVGGSGEIVYDGTSCVIDGKGNIALL
ncbi:MAG: NAD+ synthase, partial [Alistipes sp.]|nr:NAD+ synthase [Alistipes sp.]